MTKMIAVFWDMPFGSSWNFVMVGLVLEFIHD